MNKKLIIVAVACLALGGGGAAAYFMLVKPAPEGQPAAPVYEGPPGLVSLDAFLVNISDEAGERFAKLDLRLTVVPLERATRIDEDPLLQAKMRDRILTLLASKDYAELSTPIGKEGFRREIKTVLEPLIDEGELQEVLFQDFVVQ